MRILLLISLLLAIPAWALPPLKALIAESFPHASRIEVEPLQKTKLPQESRLEIINPYPPIGLVNVRAQWPDESGRMNEATMKVSVRVYAPVAIAARPISQQSQISRADIKFVTREITRFSHTGYFSEWGGLDGLRVSRYVRAGEVLGGGNTIKPYAISRGQVGEATLNKGRIRVRARVQALENGRLGQWIRVKNATSQRIFQARVTGAGKLSIN